MVLAAKISSLIFAASTMDARPTAPLYDVFRLFAPQIQAQLTALAQTLKSALPAVNTALRAANSPRIVPRAAELRTPAPDGFYCYGYADRRALHSFPTRRSSDPAAPIRP